MALPRQDLHGLVGVRRQRTGRIVSPHVRVRGRDDDGQQKQPRRARGRQPGFAKIGRETERERAEDDAEAAQNFRDARPVDVKTRASR